MTEIPSPETYRLFLAISLPEAVISQLEEIQRSLRRAAGRAQVRWTQREQLHLTMKFLGNVLVERCPALRSAVAEACASFPPLRLSARHVGFFPHVQKPRVIWVGVQDVGGLLPKLHEDIERKVASFSQKKPEGRFQAHVTIARVKQIRRDQAGKLADVAVTCGADDLGSWTSSHLDLIRSQLSAEGSRYSVIGNAAFAASPHP